MKCFSRNFSKPVRDFLVVLDEEETDPGKVCGHLNSLNNIMMIITITILMVCLCCPHLNQTHYDHQAEYVNSLSYEPTIPSKFMIGTGQVNKHKN